MEINYYCSNNFMCHLSRFDLNRVYNNHFSVGLYKRDLHTTIIRFTRNLSSHMIDWILSELLLSALSCVLYCKLGRLMNALERECVHETSINVNKLLAVLLLHVYLFILFVVATFLFIRWTCKQAHYLCLWTFCLWF